MRKKKSKFWLFCFSLIPGAGEMYLGFMKMGVSLMGVFLGLFSLATFFEMGPLLFFNIVIWFYGFFHAHNLGNMPDEEFHSLKDDYLFASDLFSVKSFSGRSRLFVGWFLVIAGIYWLSGGFLDILWNSNLLSDFILLWLGNLRQFVLQMAIGAGIIYVGIKLIQGKSESITESLNQEKE